MRNYANEQDIWFEKKINLEKSFFIQKSFLFFKKINVFINLCFLKLNLNFYLN